MDVLPFSPTLLARPQSFIFHPPLNMPAITSTAPKSTRWAWTFHDYTDAHVQAILDVDPARCVYLIAGQETCPATQRRHLQGYVIWKNAVRLQTCKTLLGLGPTVHCEIARGTTEQNIDYCKKDREEDDEPNAVVHQVGAPPMSPAQRAALGGDANALKYETAWLLAKQGNLEDIDATIRVRHYSTLKKIAADTALLNMSLVDLDDNSWDNLWLYGEAGTGKSFTARNLYSLEDVYLKMCNKWWDGYQNEDNVLIEDFDKIHGVLGHHIKIWADRYPFLCEQKGRATKIRPRKIIVTSNYHPKEIWEDNSTLQPVLRRFRVLEFKKLDCSISRKLQDFSPLAIAESLLAAAESEIEAPHPVFDYHAMISGENDLNSVPAFHPEFIHGDDEETIQLSPGPNLQG